MKFLEEETNLRKDKNFEKRKPKVGERIKY